MTGNSWVQLLLFLGALVALTKPLGWFMARVYQDQRCGLDWALGWFWYSPRTLFGPPTPG